MRIEWHNAYNQIELRARETWRVLRFRGPNMATAYVTIGTVVAANVMDGSAPISETVTTSASSTATTKVAGNGCFAKIVCATSLWAKAGATVTAATGIICNGGAETYIACVPGQPIALMDV